MPASYAAPALPRIPLVPQSLLKAHGVDCIIDTRFRAAARLLQSLWLKDNNIATGLHIRPETNGDVLIPLESLLSREAANAGRNFLSPSIHTFVRHELILREEGACYDEERLFGNALSSMPLAFNVFAPLAMDLTLASTVFRQLLPDFVNDVLAIRFETSPGRREERFLNDGTAFDLAIEVTTPDGESATIFTELKYSESMEGPAARYRERYDQASREVGLYIDPDASMLRSLALEQLWREHMTATLAVNEGVTPRAMFLAIGPRLNRRVQAAFRCYANELIPEGDLADDKVRFQAVTLEIVIDAIHQAGAVELAKKLWARYCDFERVFHLAMAEYTQPDPSNGDPTDKPRASSPTTRTSKAKNGSRGIGEISDASVTR
ncbi:PGN_0703 family putative restriction endonuclease [Bradyrhizobium sp. JYMT SZCCT0428]|uniref:PGN_0703 family putative restriction endonuclease n=1 Tax=Bradyrhizobium sp. JYMT SZCCT0428 TaxID=2807673 RepID=UPI001BA484A6|nr:hypothetical protein [Bradyrhizobium sp. JYMT SZCCT0428]MBR1154301.1 hypothetical protein [Bradyrhizobium sp. JYMT SZCCT0428]